VARIRKNGRVPRDSVARIRLLCDEHEIVAKARRRTRYPPADRIDDAELERRLCAFAEAEGLADDPQLVGELATEAARLLRDALVKTLIEDHALRDVAAGACARAGIPEREPQVCYCLVVLCQKADDPRRRADGGPPRRTYELDVGEDGFDEQLRRWAAAVATNMAAWHKTFEAIAAAMPDAATDGAVRATRNQAAEELAAVDPQFGRSFRRYAMRTHGLR